jgi:hypothetical protein
MLSKEQKWRLERGLSLLECGYYSCKSCPNHTDEKNMWTGHCWIEEGSFCPVEYSDWKDAAEFAARVAATLTGLKAEELPCYPNFLCPYSAKLIGSCKACYLKHARLAVEQEMEKEGK